MRGGVVRRYMYILFVLHVGFFVWRIMLHLCILVCIMRLNGTLLSISESLSVCRASVNHLDPPTIIKVPCSAL
jgi:hypothetical protein